MTGQGEFNTPGHRFEQTQKHVLPFLYCQLSNFPLFSQSCLLGTQNQRITTCSPCPSAIHSLAADLLRCSLAPAFLSHQQHESWSCSCRELEDVAAEMGQMGAGSNGRTQVPSTHHMQRQLDGMLQQQSVAEALLAEQRHHHHTQHLLDSEREKLHAATSEV